MKTTILTTRSFGALAACILSFSGVTALADSHAPPPSQTVETYVCNYNDGKDMDDLMSARDYYLKQSEKAGLKPEEAYLWSLFKGAAPADFVWFNLHENLTAFAADADAEAKSSEMTAVTDRFNTVATCQANLGVLTPVFAREAGEGDGDDTTVVGSSACMLKHGVGAAQVRDLSRHINGVLTGMGDQAPAFAAMINPMTPGPTTADFYLFSVNDNATAWANFVTALQASEAGQMLGRHFDSVVDCNLSIWIAEQVVAGDDG